MARRSSPGMGRDRDQGDGSGHLSEPAVDPELEMDLGDGLGLRGDRVAADLEAARSEAALHLETAQRVQAEFENYRKRVARDQADVIKRAGERVVEGLLPVVDSLERAVAHARDADDSPEILLGVELVLGQLLELLGKEGVVAVDPLGREFDATRHQAVGQLVAPELPEGTVVEVYSKGYEMHGRTVRAAMVVVSTGGSSIRE